MKKQTLKINFRVLICEIPIIVLFLVSCIIITSLITGPAEENFLVVCRYGTFTTLICFILLICVQKRIITLANIFFLFFTLYQFGVPILYALIPDYDNFYSSLISAQGLLASACYSTLSTIAFTMAMIPVSRSKGILSNRHAFFGSQKAIHDCGYVKQIGIILAIATGIVAIPLYSVVAILSIRNGFSQATRGLLSANPIFNLTRAFFIPSLLLYICYSTDKKGIGLKIVTALFFYACLMSLIIGDRSTALSWLMAYAYDYYAQSSGTSKIKRSRNTILFVTSVLIFATIATYIAINRQGGQPASVEAILQKGLLMQVVSEMGFNFYSLCFTYIYVPTSTPFQLGLTYIKSIISLIPSSIDILHITDNILLPGKWMIDMNHDRYNGLLDFGTGFSFNAESYMNFSWLGLIASFTLPFILKPVFSLLAEHEQGWGRYTRLVIFSILVTFPRRSFSEAITFVEYQIFFLGLLILLIYRIMSKRIRKSEMSGEMASK